MNNFFVLGNPRSGTSLFRSLLNAHQELVVPPECGFALWLQENWSKVDLIAEVHQHEFAHAVQECRKFETWSLDTQELIAALASRPILNYADAVSRIYEAYGVKRGKQIRMWGDKNNYYINQIQELKSLYPDARFLHIVRDVRDVACSYLELAKTNISSKYRPVLSVDPDTIANEWLTNNLAAIEQLEGSHNYKRIRYEDLVSNVEEIMSGVLHFLGFENTLWLNISSHIGELDEPKEFMQWKKKLASPVDARSVGRYKLDLATDSCEIITTHCEALLERLGYLP